MIITDGDDGVLAAVDDVEALIAALEPLMREPERIEAMGGGRESGLSTPSAATARPTRSAPSTGRSGRRGRGRAASPLERFAVRAERHDTDSAARRGMGKPSKGSQGGPGARRLALVGGPVSQNDFALDKSNDVLYMFSLGILSRAWAGSRAARKGPRLFEKGKSWLNHNRRARGRDFSIPIARNPLKRLDPEK